MGLQVRFVIPGRLKGKGRPRATIRAGFATVYTPAATKNAEAQIKQFASDAMKGRDPIEGPVELTVAIYQMVPSSWSKKRARAAVYLTGKPDIDNSIKMLADSGNGIVWRDDAQISDLHVIRRYIQEGQERCEITVMALADTADAPLLQAAQ